MNGQSKTLRAAIYARISEDTAGEGRGVARQLEDCRALAESRDWEVVAEFTDNDISAYSGARRPGYTALMSAVEAREVDRIVVYMTSRLWRSRKERAGAMETLERLRVGVAPVSGTELDFATASGRMVAGILGEFDTAESAIKSERVARAAEQRAREGRPSGDLGYGWRKRDDGTYVLDDDEAPIVREVVKRLTAGETLDGVCRDLNARGVPSPGAGHARRYRSPENPDGSLWVPSGLRKTALRPSNAALRVHRGEVIGAASWPAIITEDAHRAVVAALTDPRRMTNGGTAVRRHLLSFGIGKCGVCGARLRVSVKGGNALYVCDGIDENGKRPGCVGRRQARVDQYVEMVLIERIKQPDAVALLAHAQAPNTSVDPAAQVALEAVRARLDDAARLYSEGRIDLDQLTIISDRLRPQVEAAERAVRQMSPTPTSAPKELARMVGHRDARAVWDRLDVVAKRQVLEALGITVTILKTKQGPGFDPDSVKIEWGTS